MSQSHSVAPKHLLKPAYRLGKNNSNSSVVATIHSDQLVKKSHGNYLLSLKCQVHLKCRDLDLICFFQVTVYLPKL